MEFLNLENIENDPEVKEILEIAETEEIEKLALEHFEKSKCENHFLELKENEIFNVLNASYIAQRFFNKSRSWISQKLNHNIRNGKEVYFTVEEYKKLREAIEIIARELQKLAEDM